MDIKKITEEEIKEIIARTGFDYDLIKKDYYITILLYLLKDVKGIYFKGGTALNKTLLNHSRISEDIDYTLEKPIAEVRKEITEKINRSGIFGIITKDKDVEGFTRLIVPYKEKEASGIILIDLNERAKMLTKPESKEIKHFYPGMPKFSVLCLSTEEMIAEKMAAAIQRNKPRDHYDLYRIIKNKNRINTDMVKKKCEETGNEFNIIRMFNRAKKLYKHWNEDLQPLLVEEVTFEEVMKTISSYFGLKEEKEKLKDK